MKSFLDNKLGVKHDCTGGLLFLICASAVAFMLIFTTVMSRMTMIRSAAESFEHTIALQCLASYYTNPKGNDLNITSKEIYNNNPVEGEPGEVGDWSYFPGDASIHPLGTNTPTIHPVELFNNFMTGVGLMHKDHTSDGVKIRYVIHSDTEGNGYGLYQPSLELQVNPFDAFTSWWLTGTKIQPRVSTVVIESSYSTNEGGGWKNDDD